MPLPSLYSPCNSSSIPCCLVVPLSLVSLSFFCRFMGPSTSCSPSHSPWFPCHSHSPLHPSSSCISPTFYIAPSTFSLYQQQLSLHTSSLACLVAKSLCIPPHRSHQHNLPTTTVGPTPSLNSDHPLALSTHNDRKFNPTLCCTSVSIIQQHLWASRNTGTFSITEHSQLQH